MHIWLVHRHLHIPENMLNVGSELVEWKVQLKLRPTQSCGFEWDTNKVVEFSAVDTKQVANVYYFKKWEHCEAILAQRWLRAAGHFYQPMCADILPSQLCRPVRNILFVCQVDKHLKVLDKSCILEKRNLVWKNRSVYS